MKKKKVACSPKRLLENYPDVLSLQDIMTLMNRRTTKSVSNWLKKSGIYYFKMGGSYCIPKSCLIAYMNDGNGSKQAGIAIRRLEAGLRNK